MRVLIINLGILLCGLISLEAIFGDWWLDNRLFLTRIPRSIDIEFPSGALYQGVKHTRYKRDKYGFRGDYGTVDSIDIITLGGSTTDQRFIDESQTWQVHLANYLKQATGKDVRIANAGVDGHSSYGHIASYEHWFSFIPKLKARYHLIYVGLNDKYEGLVALGADYVDPVEPSASQKALDLVSLIKEKSAFYNAYLNARGYLQKKSTIGHYAGNFDSARWLSMDEYEQSFLPERDMPYIDDYKRRISRLIALVRERGAVPIIVNQRGIRYIESGNQKLFMVEGDWSDEYSAKIAWLEMQYALATMESCRKSGAICIDLYSELGPELKTGHFYDPDHNAPAGTKLIGEYLGMKLRAEFADGIH